MKFKADTYPCSIFFKYRTLPVLLQIEKKHSSIEVSAAYTHTKMNICKKPGFQLRVVFSNTISQI